MGRKKKVESYGLLESIQGLEEARNLSRDFIVESLEFALARAYVKTFFTKANEDALIRAKVDIETGEIIIYRGWNVVLTDDEIEDDFKQKSVEELSGRGLKYEPGEVYEVPHTLRSIIEDNKRGMRFISSFKSNFQQRLLEAEKQALLEIYGSKLGELVTGIVENYNDIKGECIVDIGKMKVTLEKKEKIGDETFKPGQEIKVCIVSVESTTKGAYVRISRSDPMFLRRLFEQEVREIYDGTVVIKGIARVAGTRSKVAVYSTDPNVDPCGSCIGVNGTRIQAITQSLGNAREKEKIDVVLYDPCIEKYIVESLVPGHVVGVAFSKEIDNYGKEVDVVTAVTKNGDVSTTVGIRGVNALLSYKLTGYKVKVMELDEALREGINFMGLEEIRLKAEGLLDNQVEEIEEEILPVVEETEEVCDDTCEEVVEEKVEVVEEPKVEVKPVEKPVEVKPTPTPVTTPKVEKPKAEVEHVEVELSMGMDDLLSKLEEEKQQATKQGKKKTAYKKKEEKKEVEEVKKPIQGMAIYSEEELEQIRLEEEYEEESYGVDIDDDYDDYDDDDYYED